MTVCFAIDKYIEDLDKPHWFADISDGTRIFGDDGRPGLEPNSWYRLRDYLYQNGLYIKKLFIRFRSHVEEIGESDIGYIFRKGILAAVVNGQNFHRFIVGVVREDGVHVQVWNVPELIKDDSESEVRTIESVKESIIWNNPNERTQK